MLGADVVKVEPPAGDGTRWVEPLQHGMGTNFICMNVTKRDVVLDFKKPEDKAVLLELVREADIFVQNFRGGVIERLGLGWDVLRALNPRLIYCSISGFGESGPLAHAGAADYVMQAYSGFASLNGPVEGAEQFRFSGFIDLATSSTAMEGILAALIRREQTGAGQKIDLSMVEAALEVQGTRLAELLLAGHAPVAAGSRSLRFAPDRAYPTLDREVFVTVRSDAEWRGFVEAVGLPELLDDARFATNPARVGNAAALDAVLEPRFLTASAVYWMRALERKGIPAGIAHHFETFRHHAQVVENGLVAELDTPDWGRVAVAGLPWRFARTPGAVRPPSAPGADNEGVCGPIRARLAEPRRQVS